MVQHCDNGCTTVPIGSIGSPVANGGSEWRVDRHDHTYVHVTVLRGMQRGFWALLSLADHSLMGLFLRRPMIFHSFTYAHCLRSANAFLSFTLPASRKFRTARNAARFSQHQLAFAHTIYTVSPFFLLSFPPFVDSSS